RMTPGPVGVAVREVVDHLLQAYRVLRRKHPLAQETADVAVGGGVDVDGEGGERIRRGSEEPVLVDGVVCLGVARLLRIAPWIGRGDRADRTDHGAFLSPQLVGRASGRFEALLPGRVRPWIRRRRAGGDARVPQRTDSIVQGNIER